VTGLLLSAPWSPAWQGLLAGLGWFVAQVYSVIPNYGVTIIILTLVIRLILLPLGIKQVRSMQQMQAIQPKLKQLQQKYKGNKQKIQEEQMKLYREMGVNPFGGCWPMLLQMPILIAMYSVVRFPQHPPHLPAGSEIRTQIELQVPPTTNPANVPKTARPVTGTGFLGMNLLCNALESGQPQAILADKQKVGAKTVDLKYPVNCGTGVPSRIPYYILAVFMFGTTYYSQRQMQQASPPGASSQQQQAMLKFMPLMFGVFGFIMPVGLVLYWTISNVWQIGQQHFIIKAREKMGDALPQPKKDGQQKAGFMTRAMERAEQQRKEREELRRKTEARAKKPATGKPGAKSGGKPGTKSDGSGKPGTGTKKPGSGGGSGAGSRKKRPKR
jgi:YidC/Oxa1 family membrane protein insertase